MLLFASVYFGLAAAAALAARRALRAARAGPGPASVTVVVACKGGGPHLEKNVAAMLDQDYDGALEFVFVVPRADDPARGRLERALAAAPRPARVVVSDARPATTTELVLNFTYGAAAARADSEVLAFAPCDIRPARRWVRALTAPLADAGVGAATTSVVCVADGPLLPAALLSLWLAELSALHALSPKVTGQSFALRRREYLDWDVAGLWSRSLVEDLSLDALVRARGRRVVLAGAATPCTAEPASWAGLRTGLTRWAFYGRHCIPTAWWECAAAVGAKLFATAWMAWFPNLRWVLAVFLLADAAAAWALMAAFAPALEGHVPELRARHARLRLAAVPAAVLLAPLAAYNLFVSLGIRSIVWSGWRYTVRGPRDVSAEPGEAPGPPAQAPGRSAGAPGRSAGAS